MAPSTTPLEQRLRLAHQARRAKEHQLDDIRRALCDVGIIQDDDPYGHADLADVIRQAYDDQDGSLRRDAVLSDGHYRPVGEQAACCVCGASEVVYRNYREQPFCGPCANCDCDQEPCIRKKPDGDGPPRLKSVPRDDLWRAIEEEVYQLRERTMLWGETDGITQTIADHARRAVQQHLEKSAVPCKCGHPKDRHRDDPHLCLDCWRTGTTGTGARLFGDTREHEHRYQPKEQS